MNVPFVPLKDVVVTKTGSRNPSATPDMEFDYVDVASVDNAEKRITGARRMVGQDAPSRARKLIRTGDVLLATIRPNLNAVALVPPSLDGEVASTGFCVLRARDAVLPEYLFYFCRSASFVGELCKLVAGAMYPAVTDSQVLDQRLPMRELGEQRRIVDLLSRAEGIVRLRREAAAKAAELIPALFIHHFGDPATNPMGWQQRKVSDFVAKFVGGKNIQAGDGAVSPLRILKVSAVTSGQYLEHESKPAPNDHVAPTEHIVRKGDLLFSRANTSELVGATALVEQTNGTTLLPDKLWRFVWREEVEPIYAWALFQSKHVRQELSQLASGTSDSMRNISQAKLFELSLPWAPMEAQRAFAEQARAAQSIGQQQTTALAKAQATFDALLAQAFAPV